MTTGFEIDSSNPYNSLWEDVTEEEFYNNKIHNPEEHDHEEKPTEENFSKGSVSKILQDQEINKKTLASIGGLFLIGIVGYYLLKK